MTRKRFYKLVLSTGCQRNRAQQITAFARKHGLTINREWKSLSVGAICCVMAVDSMVNSLIQLSAAISGGNADDL